ncbi:hypothetical protein B0H13DRAFT_2325885 [Mycena leptocephala]|nr:hypothetical protein B0H13DRAFT_2325885 [Mycena leptocephala]
MLSRSSLSLLALLSCISTVAGGPIRTFLHRRGRNVLIGYRYVSAAKAAEYNAYGRLTAVGASGTQLGDGAYVSPTINEWQVDDSYWQCAIFADEDKFRNVAKMYIPESSNTFFSSSRLNSYLSQARLDPRSTILFSKIDGDPDQHIQMVIPPSYLARSPGFRGAYGNGDLGILVRCVPKNQQDDNYYGNAGWGGTWNIPGYGCDFMRKRDGSASCPLPSPAGPIEIPSSLIPTPSGDISTVSSYSFTETSITASPTATQSDISYFPSGSSSAVPPPVSGLSTGSIVFVSSSAFSFPSPIPSSPSGSGSAGVPGSSAPASLVSSAAGLSASGQSSAMTTKSSAAASSVPASSAKSSAAAISSARPASSSANSSAIKPSSVKSPPSSTPVKSSAVKSTPPTTSAKPTTTKPVVNTTKPVVATTKKPTTTPKPKGGH